MYLSIELKVFLLTILLPDNLFPPFLSANNDKFSLRRIESWLPFKLSFTFETNYAIAIIGRAMVEII